MWTSQLRTNARRSSNITPHTSEPVRRYLFRLVDPEPDRSGKHSRRQSHPPRHRQVHRDVTDMVSVDQGTHAGVDGEALTFCPVAASHRRQ